MSSILPRRFTDDRLVIASHNPGKVGEIADFLAGRVGRFDSAADHGVPEPEETGATFVENAVLKARHTAEATGLPALADDSGLAVGALGGAPGIFSARWAEDDDGNRDFAVAMRRVHDALGDAGDRGARFVCALALAWPDGHVEVVEGRVDGWVVWPPRGDRGFGYDPMFQPDGYDQTFAEMAPGAKHAMSHRADAFDKLVARVFGA